MVADNLQECRPYRFEDLQECASEMQGAYVNTTIMKMNDGDEVCEEGCIN